MSFGATAAVVSDSASAENVSITPLGNMFAETATLLISIRYKPLFVSCKGIGAFNNGLRISCRSVSMNGAPKCTDQRVGYEKWCGTRHYGYLQQQAS